MASFFIYDITFLIAFTIFIVFFLRTRKKSLSKEGIIFMYRTQLGVKAINYIGDNFKKTLKFLKGPIIFIGLVLMIAMLWLLEQTLSIYILHPEITDVIKAPPIAPLIPYFPELFGVQSFFPPFYFTYFLVALAIVAVVHEFSHGIFMRRFGIKIKSTGMVFLGPILGAFVEEDRKSFEKKKISEQMTVLGAGVFANLVFALIFYLLYVAFFISTFSAGGYIFNSYGVSEVSKGDIRSFEPFGNFTKMTTTNGNYYLDKVLGTQLDNNESSSIFAYSESPAFLAQIKGVIIQANDVKIMNQESLQEFLANKRPGDFVRIITETDTGKNEYDITLIGHPDNSTKAYLGIGHITYPSNGVFRKFIGSFMSFKEPSTHYVPKFDGNFVIFISDLFWWVMVINLLVALFNMLPVGIMDGGRFFYLAIFSITGSEKIAKGAFKFITYAILFVFFALMFYWLIGIL